MNRVLFYLFCFFFFLSNRVIWNIVISLFQRYQKTLVSLKNSSLFICANWKRESSRAMYPSLRNPLYEFSLAGNNWKGRSVEAINDRTPPNETHRQHTPRTKSRGKRDEGEKNLDPGGNWWNPARDICPVETRRKEREEERARKVHVCVCVCVRIGRNRAAAKNLCFSSDRSLEAGREAVWRALVSQPTVSPFPTTDVVIAHETRLFPFLLSSFLRATACRAAYIPYICT